MPPYTLTPSTDFGGDSRHRLVHRQWSPNVGAGIVPRCLCLDQSNGDVYVLN